MPPTPTAPLIRNLTSQVSTISLPFDRLNRIPFGMRTTVVRLPSGRLAVVSPSPLTPPVTAHLASLGNDVTYLIAPDIEHHIHLSAWKAAFPNAYILAPHGLSEKRKKQGQDDTGPFAHTFRPEDFAIGKERTAQGKWGTQLPPDHVAELEDQFEVEYVHSHANREIVLLHKPDGGTIIQADIIFNLPANEQYSLTNPRRDPTAGLLTKLALAALSVKLDGGESKGQRRFGWWVTGKADRKGFADAVTRIDGWQFERIIPCHGDVIEKDAKAKWSDVFRWFLDLKV